MAKIWSMSKHPLADEWIKKTWHAYTMEGIQPDRRMKYCLLQTQKDKLENVDLRAG
jgi:hypothetical protein